jgi:hypothetical protein
MTTTRARLDNGGVSGCILETLRQRHVNMITLAHVLMLTCQHDHIHGYHDHGTSLCPCTLVTSQPYTMTP